MNIEDRNEGSKGYESFRMGLDIGMGTLYLVLGVILVTLRFFGKFEFNVTYATILGCLMIGYGLFRLYRGVIVLLRRKKGQ
jgi:uncharacterized membrane protein